MRWHSPMKECAATTAIAGSADWFAFSDSDLVSRSCICEHACAYIDTRSRSRYRRRLGGECVYSDGNSPWQICVRTSVLIERTKRTPCRTMVRIINVIGLGIRNFRRNRDRNTVVTWFWISFQVDILRLWFIINIYEIFQHYKKYISTYVSNI